MNTAQYNHLFSFIWNIANDVLVHAFEKGEYKKIIMPNGACIVRVMDIFSCNSLGWLQSCNPLEI